MSLTGVSPLIADWMRLGLKWKYVWSPKLQPIPLAPGQQFQLPTQDYTFTAPEGILITFNALFDHPKCGIRFECHPNLDSADFFSVDKTVLFGINNLSFYLVGFVPPKTPPGIYVIAESKELPWREWMRLYLFNSDSVPHTCFGFGFFAALLEEPRPDDRLVPLKEMARVHEMLELYPELRNPLRSKLTEEANRFIEEMKLKMKLVVD